MPTRETIGAYELLSRHDLPEYRVEARHLVHPATGCEVLHLAADDRENLFAFCLSTPPHDDTGVSHIIEHSVLSGSRRYPLKEPFSALMKGSMHTFLNALTYPDRTVYPAASCNRADFFNLLSVYGDAVFHPLLRKETFMQEAWRLEEAEGTAGLRYAGVVYNEMKGAYSSPDSIVAEWALRSLFPDTPYRHDSGGNPRSIPSLTLEAARAFHARYYHPSNCRIFLYGDIPLDGILAFLHERFLSGFEQARIDAGIPPQPRWGEPRRSRKTYPVKPQTPLDGRSTVTVSWLLPAGADPATLVAYEVVSEVLIESAGSPLRKALVDSGLGQDLSPVSGLEIDLKEMVFAVGLRGTDAQKAPLIEKLVLDTLAGLAGDGLDPGLVGSMIDRVEFRHREIKGNGSPYALRLMGRALRGWVHGADPISSLRFAASMQELKARLAADPRYLSGCIRKSLCENPHRVSLVVEPDREQEAREAALDAEMLSATLGRLSASDKAALRSDAAAFRAYQLAADSPEARASIPLLHREDLPPEIERIPVESRRTGLGVDLDLHDIFTNEIVYLDLCFPTDGLPSGLVLLLPLFARAVTGMGLAGIRYDKVALELFRLTGGFSGSLDAGGVVGMADGFAEHAFFRMRCLRQNLAPAADLVGRLLSEPDFTDLERLRDLVLELRNDMKSALIPGGHQFAQLRAAAMLSPAVAREEQWRGITQLLFLEELSQGLDARLEGIAADLGRIRQTVLLRTRLRGNATAAHDCFGEISAAVDALAARLPSGIGKASGADHPGPLPAAPAPRLRGESLVSSAAVGYVARALPGIGYEDPRSPAAAVLGHLLSTGYLWEKVRMEGGAYGAFSYPRTIDALFMFGSYRDPHITSTLSAFRAGLENVAEGAFDEAEIEQAIIGTAGKEDRPLDPGDKGFASLQRKLHGVTDSARQARRALLINADRGAVAQAARQLLEGFDRGFSVVISGQKALAEAAIEVPDLGGSVIDLPE